MNDRATRRFGLMATLVLAAAALALTGCATVGASSTRYVGAPTFPAGDPARVEILRREPRRPHDQLGEVVLRPSGNPEVSELEAALRREAAKLGADAAVVVQDRTRRMGTFVSGPWWSRQASPVYGRVIVAVAIRYR
jgi:hypothetical protein